MKSKINLSVIGIILIILGVMIAVGPHTFIHVCTSETCVCRKTANAEIYVGITIVIEGILLNIIKSEKIRYIISALGIVSGIFTILFPTVITGVCSSPNMRCRRITRPALIIFGSLVILFALINIIKMIMDDRKRKIKEGVENE